MIDKIEQGEEQVILIKDYSVETVLSFVKYLYTDECEINLNNAITLLKAAGQFQVERLKILCEQTISSNISDNNVCHLLIEADRNSAETLKYMTMNYILTKFDLVSKTTSFGELMKARPDLAMEIL